MLTDVMNDLDELGCGPENGLSGYLCVGEHEPGRLDQREVGRGRRRDCRYGLGS